MNSQDEPKPTLTPEEQRIKDEKYAKAILAMSDMEARMRQNSIPEKKHFISKKKLIYIVVSLILTVLSLFISPLNPLGGGPTSSNNQLGGSNKATQGLKDTSELLQEANQ